MKILKIGHRGAMGHLAENTLESIQVAIDLGVDAVEIDVHKCKSGELVVIHDFNLERTTNGTGEISQKSLEELKELQIEGKYFIPTLTEVLDLIQGKCGINIELKGQNSAVATCEIIERYIAEGYWLYEDFIVSGFQKKELWEVYKINPQIPLGILTETSVSEAIELGKKINAKAIHPSLGIITRQNVLLSQQKGFHVNVWTVNKPTDIKRMINFGVNGIISDFPELLVETEAFPNE